MDQEEVAYIFDKYHLISAPVIDSGGRLVGQITVDDIVEVIRTRPRKTSWPWPVCPTPAATPP
jgi:Mg/Co/Ni transporter MgtE